MGSRKRRRASIKAPKTDDQPVQIDQPDKAARIERETPKRKRRCTIVPRRYIAPVIEGVTDVVSCGRNGQSASSPSTIASTTPSSTKQKPVDLTVNTLTDTVDSERLCMWEGCEKVFVGKVELGRHFMEHLESSSGKVCEWEGCIVNGTKHRNSDWLRRHIPTHTGIKPMVCSIGDCHQAFDSVEELQVHITRSHIDSTSSQQTHKPIQRQKPKYELQKPISWEFAHQIGVELERLEAQGIDTANFTVELRGLSGATRPGPKGTEHLVIWHPEGILEPQWIVEDDSRQISHKNGAIEFKFKVPLTHEVGMKLLRMEVKRKKDAQRDLNQ